MKTQFPGAVVLAVDDTAVNLRLLTAVLGPSGYDVRTAATGRQALEEAAQAPPDLVLLDVTMPEMDGYEVCRRFKADPSICDVPILFLTAHGEPADKAKGFEVGAADYITKPFDPEDVFLRVEVHLSLRKARRDLEAQVDKLRALEQQRDDLVKMVVHDMRSPITALTVTLGLLLEEAAPQLSAESREDLTAASEAAATLNRMANDLLDVSRLEEGKLPLVRQPSELVALARGVCDRLSVLDRTRLVSVEGEPATARCDPMLMTRVLENLVGNAFKHTPAGGRIRVVVGQAGACVRVSVQDEGPGVPVAARTRIFEKFGALATRQDHTYHSVGLGLAFCRLAVTAHGGAIGVETATPTGSVFWLELPA